MYEFIYFLILLLQHYTDVSYIIRLHCALIIFTKETKLQYIVSFRWPHQMCYNLKNRAEIRVNIGLTFIKWSETQLQVSLCLLDV